MTHKLRGKTFEPAEGTPVRFGRTINGWAGDGYGTVIGVAFVSILTDEPVYDVLVEDTQRAVRVAARDMSTRRG